MTYNIGIDLGGSNIAVGLVDEGGGIVSRESIKTRAPRSTEDICQDMAELVRSILRHNGVEMDQVEHVGVGAPGMVVQGVLTFANNLMLNHAPLEEVLGGLLQKEVRLLNDADAAACGEWLAGVGRGCSSLVALTIGTGFGCGIILDNRLYTGFRGGAGELGHTIIERNGRRCNCGKRGCLEAYCSATSIKNMTREAIAAHPEGTLAQIAGNPQTVSAKAAFDAMRLGDPDGRRIVDDFMFSLAIGVANAIHTLQPEMICLGGGVSREGDAILLPLREMVRDMIPPAAPGERTRIETALLGNDAGIIGAAMMR